MGNTYQYRNIARVVIETKTPLSVGAGEKDLLTDHIVARDVNNLPYIPGTAIAGIIRHAIGIREFEKSIFGFKESKVEKEQRIKAEKENKVFSKERENIDEGSEVIFSSAQIVDEDGMIIEGLLETKDKSGTVVKGSSETELKYLENFDELPIRQHVRINDKGTGEKHGKFDEQVVYKGTRFCFEIELLSKTNDKINFEAVLNELSKDTIRLGGGTRKGFGEIKIVECKYLDYDLYNSDDLQDYIRKTSSLNDDVWKQNYNENFGYYKNPEKHDSPDTKNSDNYTTYKLELQPDDFFLFSSGFGNDEADIMPVFENYFDWSSRKPQLKENAILIPGSSVKGALSHRVAFHYNKIKGVFADKLTASDFPALLKQDYQIPENFDSDKFEDWRKIVIDHSPAVRALFGYALQDEKKQKRGNVLISDVIVAKLSKKMKIQNHVSIDRFTGGAIEGALFSESVIYGKEHTYTLTFKVLNDAITDSDIKNAFEEALFDITKGKLALGGGTNRGHGCFSGRLFENGKEIIK